MTMITIMTNAI